MTKSFKLLSRLDGQTPCQKQLTVLLDVMALVPYVWCSFPAGVCVELSFSINTNVCIHNCFVCQVPCFYEAADCSVHVISPFSKCAERFDASQNHWIWCPHGKLS